MARKHTARTKKTSSLNKLFVLDTTVLLHEAVDGLAIRDDGVYVDGTFGRGGHSRLIQPAPGVHCLRRRFAQHLEKRLRRRRQYFQD